MSLESKLVSVVQAIGADIKALYTRTDTFVYTKAVPSATWIITHNLGKNPSVTVVDSADNIVEGDVVYDSNNQITLTFNGGFSGKAYLN